jgi:hypothetical protein
METKELETTEKSDERQFYESGEETIESEFARTGWTIPNTPQEDAFEARLQERQTHL